MRTEYQFIRFVRHEDPAGNKQHPPWWCHNIKHGEGLGTVEWQWNQYCYFPTGPATYSAGCLRDIADFIEQVMVKHTRSKWGPK